MLQASSCPSSGEWYKIDSAYGVQHRLCCRRLVEKRWFGVHLLGLVSPLLHESTAAQPVLYTIGVVGFVPFS
jgi:hypothetical protein